MQSKIFVVKLKDLIRTAIFAIVGIAIILAIISFISGGLNKGAYNEGTYTSTIVLHGTPVEVHVTLSKSNIESIKLGDMIETQEVFYPTFSSSFDAIATEVVENQSTSIEINKDYEVASNILLNAIDKAIEQGKR